MISASSGPRADACRRHRSNSQLLRASPEAVLVSHFGNGCQMKASSIGIEAFAPSKAHHRSNLTWYSYLDRLFMAFGTGFLIGAGLMLLF